MQHPPVTSLSDVLSRAWNLAKVFSGRSMNRMHSGDSWAEIASSLSQFTLVPVGRYIKTCNTKNSLMNTEEYCCRNGNWPCQGGNKLEGKGKLGNGTPTSNPCHSCCTPGPTKIVGVFELSWVLFFVHPNPFIVHEPAVRTTSKISIST